MNFKLALALAVWIVVLQWNLVYSLTARITYKMRNHQLKEFRDDTIATAHSVQNCYRANHNAQPLQIDDSISAFSQDWADKMAQNDNFQHSGNPNYGENLFAASPDITNGAIPIYNWYKEYSTCNYNFQTGAGFGCAGHFTQVVWKGSTSVGYGMAQSPQWTYFVADYSPPGNLIGAFVQNVDPPSDNNITSCIPPGVDTIDLETENMQIL